MPGLLHGMQKNVFQIELMNAVSIRTSVPERNGQAKGQIVMTLFNKHVSLKNYDVFDVIIHRD